MSTLLNNAIIIRVYGLLIVEGRILCVRERYKGNELFKFPGGGMEFGEGIADCLIREWSEETGTEVEINEHFYTTDFFQPSAFHLNAQVISVYYIVNCSNYGMISEEGQYEKGLKFVWIGLEHLTENMFTLPIDKIVVNKLLKQNQ